MFISPGSVYQVVTNLRRDEINSYMNYMTCAAFLDAKGLQMVAYGIRLIAREEVHHAEELATRISDIGLWVPCDLQVAELALDSIQTCLTNLVSSEENTINNYTEACTTLVDDAVTHALFSHILEEEYMHHNYFTRLLMAFREGGYNALLSKSVAKFCNYNHE